LAGALAHAPATALDLGSGGGVPGLVLALAWPSSRWILLEANGRRARFLAHAIGELGLVDRTAVWARRAEALGRDGARRSQCDLVVARGFGPPGMTAECGAPFLRIGGVLAVSEPPGGDPGRWPPGPLAELGLTLRRVVRAEPAVAVLEQVGRCPVRYPRRTAGRRPLF